MAATPSCAKGIDAITQPSFGRDAGIGDETIDGQGKLKHLMDFTPFDTRRYPTLPVRAGYGEWADTYEDTVLDLMDVRLLARLREIDWPRVRRATDLACGTGRTGRWLRAAGVEHIDGVDFTEAMLERARAKNVYDRLLVRDMTDTGLDAAAYDLVTEVLGDEHLPDSAAALSRSRSALGGRRSLRDRRLPSAFPDARDRDPLRSAVR